MLDRDLYAKIAFSDFVAAGGIVFHEHISFNLKSAPVGTLEDFFFKLQKIVRQSRQNSFALSDDVTVLKRFKIVTVAWFTFSRFYPIGLKQCMFWADVNI